MRSYVSTTLAAATAGGATTALLKVVDASPELAAVVVLAAVAAMVVALGLTQDRFAWRALRRERPRGPEHELEAEIVIASLWRRAHRPH